MTKLELCALSPPPHCLHQPSVLHRVYEGWELGGHRGAGTSPRELPYKLRGRAGRLLCRLSGLIAETALPAADMKVAHKGQRHWGDEAAVAWRSRDKRHG